MPLSTTDAATFRTAVKADTDPAVVAAYAIDDIAAIIATYNATASPQVLLWRPRITTTELNTAIIWSEFSLLTTAMQQTYMAMIVTGSIDSTSANIRNGFSTVFSGKTSLTNLTALAQTPATKFQNLYTTANVCTLFGHSLSVDECIDALLNSDGSHK